MGWLKTSLKYLCYTTGFWNRPTLTCFFCFCKGGHRARLHKTFCLMILTGMNHIISHQEKCVFFLLTSFKIRSEKGISFSKDGSSRTTNSKDHNKCIKGMLQHAGDKEYHNHTRACVIIYSGSTWMCESQHSRCIPFIQSNGWTIISPPKKNK